MEILFRDYKLDDILTKKREAIIDAISSEKDEYLASINIDEYLEYIYAKFKIENIVLDENAKTCEVKQTKNRVYSQILRKYVEVDGVTLQISIPFVGAGFILFSKADEWNSNPPYADIDNDKIILTIESTLKEIDNVNVDEEVNRWIQQIKTNLEYSRKNIDRFNDDIKNVAKREIERRITNFNKFSAFLKTIPYEIKRDENAPKTYEVPTVRKKVTISKPSVSQTVPDPTLSESEYNNILEICSSMALVMERSPKTYAKMDEEAIRTQFLMQLNGQYQGQATGETFNGNGKTDILIRNDNQNIFIGECKFWKGEKAFLETIDQLLGYVTYRDTKTAILLFVKKNDFTATVNKLRDIIPKHNNYVRQDTTYTPKLNTAFRYVFKNKTDNDKELFITIMAFHVPCEEV